MHSLATNEPQCAYRYNVTVVLPIQIEVTPQFKAIKIQPNSTLIMAAEGKVILFYRCNLLMFFFYFVNQPRNINQTWPVGR